MSVRSTRSARLAKLALVVALAVALVPSEVLASRQAPTTSTSRYTLKPKKERVDVSVTMSITNRTPDSVRTGPCPAAPSRRCRITTFYTYGSMGFVAPSAAKKMRFSGAGVTSRVARKTRGWIVYEVRFSPIRQGQTRRIRATYRLPAARPRSPNTTRVTDAYAHFCWHGQFTDRGTVTATLPGGYETTNRHASVKTKKTKKGVTMRAARTRNLGKFYACTDAFDPDALLRTETTSPNGQSVVVEGWPEDPDWTDKITDGVQTVIPALEALVGAGIPAPDVRIRQVAAQALEGYAGDFVPVSGQVRVSEKLDDPKLIAHEMAHAWFHGGTLKETWMSEGLAEWAASSVTGATCDDPGEYPGKNAPRLRDWRFIEPNPSDQDLAVIDYQYASACSLMADVAELVGEERMQEIVLALLFREPKYGGDAATKRGRPDWREWLDAVDELGLVPAGVADLRTAEQLLLEQGIVRKKQLKGRASARAAYHAAAQGPLAGSMPVGVRDLMDAWAWQRAVAGIAIAVDTIERADAVLTGGATNLAAATARHDVAGATSLKELRAIRAALDAPPGAVDD